MEIEFLLLAWCLGSLFFAGLKGYEHGRSVA